MSIQAEELKEIARQVLDMLGVMDYFGVQLTYVLKTDGKWKVGFVYEYSHGSPSSVTRKTASFVIDAKSEEIEGMWLDRSWG